MLARLFAALAVLLGLITMPAPRLAGQTGSTGTYRDTAQALAAGEPAIQVRELRLVTGDLVYDPASRQILASVPSWAGAVGNSITEIDPATAMIGRSVWVGSDPDKLALADDGRTLYVSLIGAASVRRFDIATRMPGLQFPLGFSSGGPMLARDMKVLPGMPDSLAVVSHASWTSHAQIKIFDNGVSRPEVIETVDSISLEATRLASGGDPSTVRLYGYEDGLSPPGFLRMVVDSAGVRRADHMLGLIDGPNHDIDYAGGLIYVSNGQVIDPERRAVVGSFGQLGYGHLVEPDLAQGRVYFVTFDSVGQHTLRAFDAHTFAPLWSMPIAGVGSSRMSSLIRWGDNGLAFRTNDGQVFLISIGSAPATPTPTPRKVTPTPLPTATPLPTPLPGLSVRQLALDVNEMVYDPVHGRIYASVPERATDGRGNTITAIDPVAGTVDWSAPIGRNPVWLALSDNAQYLYASLYGEAAVSRLDLSSRTADLKFTVGLSSMGDVTYAGDMAVLPGSPRAPAVARRRLCCYGQWTHEGVVIYDDGVPRPVTTDSWLGNQSIEFGDSASVLYGHDNESSAFGFHRSAVDPTGVRLVDNRVLIIGYYHEIFYDGGLIFVTDGHVIDPDSRTLLGDFVPDKPLEDIAPDAAYGRAYIISGSTLYTFDLHTFLLLWKTEIPGVEGFPVSLIRWGTDGLAFRTTAGQVFLINLGAAAGSPQPTRTPRPALPPTATPAAAKAPTATPAATPSPTPAPIARMTATAGAAAPTATSGPKSSGTPTASKAIHIYLPLGRNSSP